MSGDSNLAEKAFLNEEERADFLQLRKTVEVVRTYLGGEVRESEEEISLDNYNFEGQRASISLQVAPREFGPKTYLLIPHAQLTRLRIGNLDLLDLVGDKRLNPQGVLLVPLGSENLGLFDKALQFLSSKTPLTADYFQAINAYLDKVAPVAIEDSSGWQATIPFPFSLESLSAIIHELYHLSDAENEQEEVQIKNLLSQMPEDKTDKRVEEIVGKINSIQARQENRVQMKTLGFIIPLAKGWELQDYKKRLKQQLVLEWCGRKREGIL